MAENETTSHCSLKLLSESEVWEPKEEQYLESSGSKNIIDECNNKNSFAHNTANEAGKSNHLESIDGKSEPTEPVPGSSNESIKEQSSDSHTVWIPSTIIKSENDDNDSKCFKSEEDEESEDEVGEEERLEEESDAEMNDDSNGGAYHLAEVSYGDETEDSQKAEGEESGSILGLSLDHFISAGISITSSMNKPINSDKKKNKKTNKSAEDTHIFVQTVILKKSIGVADKKGVTKKIMHFKCPYCTYNSPEKRKVVEHTYKHQVLKPYKCPDCPLSFNYASYLREHRRITHLDTPFDCKLCGRKCGKQSALDKHLRVHTGEKPFACEFCDYRSTQQSHIKVHIRQHTGEKPYKCKLCDYKCAYSALLKRHVLNHTGQKTFCCVLCDYSAKTNERLQAHIKKHSNEKSFRCDHCAKSFRTRDAIKRHIKNIHIQNQFKCECCQLTFKRQIVYKMHMDEHNTGGKRYECNLCEYKCAYKLMLSKHMLAHTAADRLTRTVVGEPQPAVLCDIFTNKNNYQERNDSTFVCNLCAKTYRSKLSIKNHVKYMHFPKQYVCKTCNLAFGRQSSLKLHMYEHLEMVVSDTKGAKG